MNKTKIEWVKNPDGTPGYTWNPITGCLNHVDGLCKGGGFPCYAYRLAHGRLKERYLANRNVAHECFEYRSHIPSPFVDPFYPRFWKERFGDIPLRSSRGIFVCDMGELFGDWLPEDWTERVLNIIKGSPQHRFYLLTKQPQNLIKFSPFTDNCWVGVTATSNSHFWKALSYLKDIKAKIKYLSLEPFLGEIIDLRSPYANFETSISMRILSALELAGISWIILGAQTKPYKPPKIEWVEEIVRAADKAGVPVFLKDNLKPILPPEVPTFYKLAEPWNEVDQKPILRQEMPKLAGAPVGAMLAGGGVKGRSPAAADPQQAGNFTKDTRM